MTKNLRNQVSLSDTLNGKLVIADTSSLLLVGTELLSVVKNCTLVIPSIVVKELENKRTHSTLGVLARSWIRLLEELRVKFGIELAKGVTVVGYENVVIRVEPNHTNQAVLPAHLQDGSNDSTILAVASNFKKEVTEAGGEQNVVLLSNDTPMRIHATLDLDIPAFEFNANQITNAKPFDGRYTVVVTEEEYAETNHEGASSKDVNLLILSKLPRKRAKNAFVTVELPTGELLGNFILEGKRIFGVNHKNKAYGITGRTLEQDVAIDYLKMPPEDVPIVSLGGSAGTGKTLLTIAVALEELKLHNYQKVIVFRSLHEMGQGQEMGFLPGGVGEKMESWAGAVFDALDVIAAKKKPLKKNAGPVQIAAQKDEAKKLREMIEVSPITYLRGRSLANTFIVLEEAQNFSRYEILNILSRVGEGSKVVLTFDAAQVDNKFLQSGKNSDIWSVIDSLKGEDVFAHMTLLKTERSRVAEIVSGILEN